MKKISKLKVKKATFMSDEEMKEIIGGNSWDLYGSYGGGKCPNAADACKNKSDGAYCESGPDCSPGTCRYAPFAGLICWRR